MKSNLYRLVYHSRNCTGPGQEATVAEILARSRVNNSRMGVTGALLYRDGYFIQVLEGPCDAVEAVFERIQQDPRHDEVNLLMFGPVERRGFPVWSMEYLANPEAISNLFGAELVWDGMEVTAICDRLRAMAFEMVRQSA